MTRGEASISVAANEALPVRAFRWATLRAFRWLLRRDSVRLTVTAPQGWAFVKYEEGPTEAPGIARPS